MLDKFLYKSLVFIGVFFFLSTQMANSNSIEKKSFFIKTFGTSDVDEFSSYDATKDGGVIIGSFTRAYSSGDDDTCLTKLNKNGDIEWSKIFIKPSIDRWIQVKESQIGGYVSVETTYSSTLLEPSLVIRRYAHSGEVISSKKYLIYTSGHYLFLEYKDGAMLLLNKFENSINIFRLNPIGNIQWQRNCTLAPNIHSFKPKQIIFTNDGGFAVIGLITYSDNRSMKEGLFLKFDYSGSLRIKKRIIHSEPNQRLYIRSIIQNNNNEYRIICYVDPYNCFIKMDKNGNIYSTKILSKIPERLYSIARTEKEDNYIIYGTYSDGVVLMEINDKDIIWKTIHDKIGLNYGSFIQKRKHFPGYISAFPTVSNDIGIIQINSNGIVSDNCGTIFTYNAPDLDISPPKQLNAKLTFSRVIPQVKIEETKEQIVNISKHLFTETICLSNNNNNFNTNSMFMSVTWFLNGKHIKVIPDGFKGKILQLHSWWGNHGLQLDLNNDQIYDHKNYDTGYRNCNNNPDTCVDSANRDFNYTNGFSLKDFYLWIHYWHDPTHGKVKCFRRDCLYKPHGAGATFKVNSRDFKCLGNEWYYQSYPMLTDSGDTIYCKQFNVCGDGVIANNEECDDYNQDNGDGCDCNCKKE